MSGLIAGIIHKNTVTNSIEKLMRRSLENYKIDKLNVIKSNNLFMLCGLQFITEENRNEILPFKDDISNIIINGDIILDNREELFDLLQINCAQDKIITDSQLVIKAYKKWGYDCPKYLIGDFSFVIYDKNKDEVLCVRDHTGCRPFYYFHDDELFAFSNITDTLIQFTDYTLNERWITDFLSILGPLNNSEAIETIYNGIYQIPPAHIMIIQKNNIIQKKYWDPINEIKPLKLKSHNEYINKFLEVFDEAVECKIRTTNDVAIMVSGGLDSGSIAAIASKKLKIQNKELKGFSFVPKEGFAEKNKSNLMVDESNYVNMLMNKCGNMSVKFCRNDGVNPMSNIDEEVQTYEQPIKTIQNSYWIDNIIKYCSNNDINVILEGQFGNATISYGDGLVYMHELLRKFNINKLIEEVNNSANRYNLSRKYIYKLIISNAIPNVIKSFMSKRRNSLQERFMYNPINPELLKKWNVEQRFDEKGYNILYNKFSDLKENKKSIVDETVLSHISIMNSKYAMKYGVIVRDPAKDKRIIEFCMSLPGSEYVHKGEDRYLIRSAMKGILPEEIRTNWKHRGVQSADWVERLKPDWDSIYYDIKLSLKDEDMVKYMDVDKLDRYLEKNKNISDNTNSNEIYCLLISLVMYKFLIYNRKNIEEIKRIKNENRRENYGG